MSTCGRSWVYGCVLVLGMVGMVGAEAVDTSYGAASVPLNLTKVPGESVYCAVGYSGVPGPTNEGHTSNAGFVVTPGGVVVFDTLGTPALRYRLQQEIRRVTDQAVKAVVISH